MRPDPRDPRRGRGPPRAHAPQRIDGEIVQQGNTANLIFSPAELVAWLSRTLTLLPGDIIATGTPAGVGAAKGRFLRDGETVSVDVEGIGTLNNPVCA